MTAHGPAQRIPVRQRHFIASKLLRDPSHATLAEPRRTAQAPVRFCGLVTSTCSYELHVGLEELLVRAVHDPGDLAEIRATVTAAAEDDRLGIPVRRDGDRIDIAYRATILLAERSAR